MARIRTVKPEFWAHPVMGRLSDMAKWLALALLNHADDEGYFRADPAIVRGAIAPFVDDSTSIRRALDECSRAGWIEVLEHPTQGWLGKVVNFAKHQKIDRPRPSTLKDYWQFDEASTSPRRILDEASTTEGNGMEGKIYTSAEPRTRLRVDYPPDFEAWWQEYPKKVGKAEAYAEWKKLRPDEALQQTLLAGARRYRDSKQVKDGYVLDPCRWIKRRRWEDETPVKVETPWLARG